MANGEWGNDGGDRRLQEGRDITVHECPVPLKAQLNNGYLEIAIEIGIAIGIAPCLSTGLRDFVSVLDAPCLPCSVPRSPNN